MEATLPSNWKSLTILKYDDTSNPNEHMDVYIMQVSLYTIDDDVLCWVFPTFFKRTSSSLVHSSTPTQLIHLKRWQLFSALNLKLVGLTT